MSGRCPACDRMFDGSGDCVAERVDHLAAVHPPGELLELLDDLCDRVEAAELVASHAGGRHASPGRTWRTWAGLDAHHLRLVRS